MKWLLTVILVLFPYSAWAACTGSSPTWSSTPDYASMASCMSSATAGDTINVSGGSQENWDSTLVISKGVHIAGAGTGSTLIGCGTADPLIEILPSNQSLNAEVEISGIAFDSNNTCIVISLGEYNYEPTTFQTRINIHENYFYGTTSGNSNYQYVFNYNQGGVIWGNTFTGKDQMFRSGGYGNFGLYSVATIAWATSQALFIEDNIFNMSGADGDYIADCQFSGASRVWRYNTFAVNNDVSWSGFIDVHGYNNDAYTSCYGDNAYGNIVTSSSNEDVAWLAARGGKNTAFYNDAITTGNVSPGVYFSYGCPTSYTDYNFLRSYAWVNTKNTTTLAGDGGQQCGDECGDWACDGSSSSSPGYPEEDIQFFNFESSFAGSTGVGCGSELPSASGCTDRVAFWVTDQSCSSTSGLTGDIATYSSRNNIAGTLYECQSEAWVAIYTPYTYPHPLRGEAAAATYRKAFGGGSFTGGTMK